MSSLRARLLLLVAVALVPALGVISYALVAHRRLLVADAREEVGRLAHLVAELHQRPVDGAHDLLLALTQMRQVSERDPACSAQLAPLLARAPAYLNLGAVDPAGMVFCSAAPTPGSVDLSDRRFFRRALETGEFGVGEYVVSRIRGVGSLGLGHAVRDERGAVVAVAFASLDVMALQDKLDTAGLPDQAHVLVLDRSGVVIASRGHPERIGQHLEPVRLRALQEADGPIDFDDDDGVHRIQALHMVTDRLGEPVVQVIASLPAVTALAPVNRITGLSLAGFAVASLVALLVTAWAGELLLVRKLRVLIATARRISSGEASARTGLEAGREELGDLVRSFDEMADSLERQQRERARLEAQLRQSQKLEALGQLAGGIAHDFNNILTAIIGCAHMIEAEAPLDHPSRADAAEIVRAGERASALTRQLLAFSRRQRLAARALVLSDVVRGLEPMLRRLLGENIDLVVEAGAPGTVLADPSQMEQVIVNLAVNARDAMPEGGRLLISVGETSSPDRAAGVGGAPPEGAVVVLTVRDTGIGMEPETLSHVFEPFFTTKGPSKGTGLGLSTVYGIVSQSGGAIRVTSSPGAGATFHVYLPLHEGPILPPEGRPRADVRGGQESVLVVEDEPAVRSVAARILRAGGYRVLEAENAEVALSLLESLDGTLHLLLTDVLLPGANGLTLAQRVAAARPGLRVVFMSGYTGEVLSGGLPDGASVLAKPFAPDDLLAIVRGALNGGGPGIPSPGPAA